MPAIPVIGKRINTIYHCLGELAQINKKFRAELMELVEVELDGRKLSKYLQIKSVFIQFNT